MVRGFTEPEAMGGVYLGDEKYFVQYLHTERRNSTFPNFCYTEILFRMYRASAGQNDVWLSHPIDRASSNGYRLELDGKFYCIAL